MSASSCLANSSWILDSIGAEAESPEYEEVTDAVTSTSSYTSVTEFVLMPAVVTPPTLVTAAASLEATTYPADATSGNICGDYDEETGEFEPCDKTIARTYSFPDISVGIAFDVYSLKPETVLLIEIMDIKSIKLDLGVSYGGVLAAIGYKVTSIVEITPFLFGGSRFPTIKPMFGAGISITKF